MNNSEPHLKRFESMSELLNGHATLLESVPYDSPFDNKNDPNIARLIREFVQVASATGTKLDAPKDRKQAQGILDYWQATSYFDSRQRSPNSTKEAIGNRFDEAVLRSFDDDGEIASRIASVESNLVEMNQRERETARRIAFQMVSLQSNNNVFIRRTASMTELKGCGNAADVDRVVEMLVRTGAMVRDGIDPGNESTFRLSDDALMRKWPTLSRWLRNRTLFREASRLWESHNQDQAALNTGQLLLEATHFNDLNDREGQFIAACRVEATRIADEKELFQKRLIESAEQRTRSGYALIVSVLSTLLTILTVIFGLWFWHNESIRVVKEREAAATKAESQRKEDISKLEKQEREKRDIRDRVLILVDFLRVAGEIATADPASPSQTLAKRKLAVLYERANQLEDKVLNVYLSNYRQTLNGLLNFSDEDRNSYRQSSDEVGKQAETLRIAHELQKYLREEEGDPEVIRQLDRLRSEYYNTTATIASLITKAAFEANALESIRPYSDEFWRLYWGEMGLFEDEEVEKTMVGFGNALTVWEQKPNVAATDEIAIPLKNAAKTLLRSLRVDVTIDFQSSQKSDQAYVMEALEAKIDLPSFNIAPMIKQPKNQTTKPTWQGRAK